MPIFNFFRSELTSTSNAFQICRFYEEGYASAFFALIAMDAFYVATETFSHSMAIDWRYIDFLIVVLRKHFFSGLVLIVRFARGIEYWLVIDK